MANLKKVMLTGNSEMVIFKFRLELIERLLEEGYEVYTAFPKTAFGDGETTSQKYGCHYIELNISSHGTNPFADLGLLRQYKRVLREVKPDILLTFTIKPNIYGAMAAASCNVPCIINVSGLGIAVEQPGLLQHITTTLYRVATKRVQCVFFQNTENEQFFADRHLADGKRKLLPGSGVSLSRFQVIEYPHGETVDFLFMARILKEKGIDQYMDASKAIHDEYPNTVFHVLGVCDDETYLTKLKELEAQGVIQYHGQQKSVLPFQEISSCTIHPTYYPEGMSNVLLESAACGRPIITTDRSGCREIIDDGINGYICKQKDSVDLIRQIEKFMQLTWEQRRAMGLAGRAKVEREFDRQIVVNAYLSEIDNAVGVVKSGL